MASRRSRSLLLVEMPSNGALDEILALRFIRPLVVVRGLDLQPTALEDHGPFLEQPHSSFLCCKTNEAPSRPSVHERDQAPLGEEVAQLGFVIAVADTAHEDLVLIFSRIQLAIFILLALGRRKAHRQLSCRSREVLHVDNGAVRISSKLECHKRVMLLALVGFLRRHDTNGVDVTILREVVVHLSFRTVAGQAAHEDFQVLCYRVIISR